MNTIANIAECLALATQLKREWFPHEPTWVLGFEDTVMSRGS
jgi:hypothetical protein